MTYTRHGHHIYGTVLDATPPPIRARCGGPGICAECSKESTAIQNKKEPEVMKITKFTRKPFEVEAVQVTAENLSDVAKWCEGEVINEKNQQYIRVHVLRALNDRQTQAFVGDWVLYAGTGYKVYNDKAFRKSFSPLDGAAKDAATQASKGQLQELRTVAEPAVG